MYKEFFKLNNKKTTQFLNWVKDLNRQFSKDVQIANKHMERCSILLAIKEMHMGTTMRYRFTHTSMVIRKKSDNR